MEARYTEGRIGNGGVSPPMDSEATLMDWRSRVPPWCSNPSARREGVLGRLWRLRLKTATQATQGFVSWATTRQDREDGPSPALTEIFLKVSRFLTSKPVVQRQIGLLAMWRTSEDCMEAKKIKSSSWSSVPDISAV
ncbi:hypothetical protein U9M48_011279 [Paspalum notatum var. saurae]|uniref:Uncharacterized protein n=1 Tax=Paspalum notatum var. saurae TaxID=547442 RepID=A0AAQ3SVB6_PASNO